MKESRLYTCPECGHAFPVEESSAGETIQCPGCQKTVTLPSLGTLRNLPVQKEPAPDPVKGQTVTALDRRIGVMVLLGVIALVFIILSAVWGYRYYLAHSYFYAISFDDWTIFETWKKWQFLRPGIDTPLTEDEHYYFYQLRMLWKWLVIYLLIAGVCIAGIIFLWIKPIRKEEKPLSANQ